jgi:hypothetical protein
VRTHAAILDKAIERYRREKFLRDTNADFAALRINSKAWKVSRLERPLTRTGRIVRWYVPVKPPEGVPGYAFSFEGPLNALPQPRFIEYK